MNRTELKFCFHMTDYVTMKAFSGKKNWSFSSLKKLYRVDLSSFTIFPWLERCQIDRKATQHCKSQLHSVPMRTEIESYISRRNRCRWTFQLLFFLIKCFYLCLLLSAPHVISSKSWLVETFIVKFASRILDRNWFFQLHFKLFIFTILLWLSALWLIYTVTPHK